MKTSITSRFILIGSYSILLALLFDGQGFAIEPNTWRTIPGPEPREGHTATLLDDGRVLIVGGARSCPQSYCTVEWVDSIVAFDPATEAFTQIGSLIYPERAGHTATLLEDGRVLIAGADDFVNRPVEIFDPQTGQTQTDARAPQMRGHTATRLGDGRVLFTGGYTWGDLWSGCEYAAIADAVLYDPATDTWTAAGTPLVASRYDHSALGLPNGHVLIVGGNNNFWSWCSPDSTVTPASIELYDAAQDRFVIQIQPADLNDHTLDAIAGINDIVLLSDGRVLIEGGWSFSTGLYDPSTQMMTWLPEMISHSAPPFEYEIVPSLADARLIALQDGRALAVGSMLTPENTWLLDLATESWVDQALTLYKTANHELTLLQDGRVLLTGGRRPGSCSSGWAACYNDLAALYYPASILPTADASATRPLWVSPIEANATVELDGSRSSDANGDPLTYEWFQDSIPIATGMIAAVSLPVGLHEIDLVVDDGLAQDTNTVTVTVLSAEQAVQRLISLVNDSDLRHKRPLLASLEAALASIERGSCHSAVGQLGAFQNKVSAQVSDMTLAAELIAGAGQVITALDCDGSPRVAARIHSLKRHPNGKVQMKIKGEAGEAYTVEASTNLVDWEAVGVATVNEDGSFEFEDAQAAKHQCRFYRVVNSTSNP